MPLLLLGLGSCSASDRTTHAYLLNHYALLCIVEADFIPVRIKKPLSYSELFIPHGWLGLVFKVVEGKILLLLF